MMRASLFAVLMLSALQVACSTEPITMWNPVSKKTVQCADENCAIQYEAAGYMRVPEKKSE